jgi:subtilisin family serine protease
MVVMRWMTGFLLAGSVSMGSAQAFQQQTGTPQDLAGLGKLKEAELIDLVVNGDPDARIHVDLILQTQPDMTEFVDAVDHLEGRERRGAIADYARALVASEQAPLLELLHRYAEEGLAEHVRELWIVNVIGVSTTPAVILELATYEQVDYIHYDPPRNILLSSGGGGPVNPACGVDVVEAGFAWERMNTRGEGVTVCVIDTGTCYTHADLINQIWVNPGEDLNGNGQPGDFSDVNGLDDDNNGYVDDLIGYSFDHNDPSPENPSDFHGHGTHTAGTVGGDGTSGQETGVAPGVNLMIARNSAEIAFEIEVWDGMQYAAVNAADFISMSLGWFQAWLPDRPTWRTNCNNTQAMGTTMVIASGNEGTCCTPVDSVRTPGDVPEVITVGSTTCSDTLSSFSSQGPVEWANVSPWFDHAYPPGMMKPTVSAPGDNIPSTWPCSGYISISGTSMATPHVAGIAALLKSVRPDMDHNDITAALEATSVDLGTPGYDNQYGAGRVSVPDLMNAYAPLSATGYTLSAATGGTIDFNVNAGPDYAGDLYWVLGSVSGNSPGLDFGSVNLPLNFDGMFALTITAANSPAFQNTRGFLDGAGQATATLDSGGPFDPVAVGVCITFAYLVYDGPPVYASNPVLFDIVP